MKITGYTESRGRDCHSAMPSITRSVIVESSAWTRSPRTPRPDARRSRHGSIPWPTTDHQIIEPGQPPLPLLDQLRLEAALAVARHLEGYRTCLRQDGFAALAVPGIAAVTAGRIMLPVAEVIVELPSSADSTTTFVSRDSSPPSPVSRNPSARARSAELPHQLVAGHTRLRLRRIQVHDSLPIINHVSHRCLLLPQELHRKV